MYIPHEWRRYTASATSTNSCHRRSGVNGHRVPVNIVPRSPTLALRVMSIGQAAARPSGAPSTEKDTPRRSMTW